MTRSKALSIVTVLITALAVTGIGSASHSGTPVVTKAAIDAITVPGTVPQPYTFGTYVDGGHGFSGTVPPGELGSYPDPNAFIIDGVFDGTRGNSADHGWLGAGEPNVSGGPITFDLGTGSDVVFVFPAFDHSPVFGGLEFLVYGTNDAAAAADPANSYPGAAWTAGSLDVIYREGWVDSNGVATGNETDDYASAWVFPADVRYIAISGAHEVNGSDVTEVMFTPDNPDLPDAENVCEGMTVNGVSVWCNDDMEIDAVAIPAPAGLQGCTPGYWKQEHHFGAWVGHSPSDAFSTTFGNAAAFPTSTLHDALRFRGGGVFALARHATAGLLSAANPGVNYPYTEQQVIDLFNAAFNSMNPASIEGTKDQLADANELGCPL